MRKMNHPCCPKINWVYHTKPDYFSDAIDHNPLPKISDSKIIMNKRYKETVHQIRKESRRKDGNKKQFDLLMQNQLDWLHVVTDYYPEGNLQDLLLRKATFKEYEL